MQRFSRFPGRGLQRLIKPTAVSHGERSENESGSPRELTVGNGITSTGLGAAVAPCPSAAREVVARSPAENPLLMVAGIPQPTRYSRAAGLLAPDVDRRDLFGRASRSLSENRPHQPDTCNVLRPIHGMPTTGCGQGPSGLGSARIPRDTKFFAPSCPSRFKA